MHNHEELAEESDKKLRVCNILLGIKEANTYYKKEAKMIDETDVTEFIEAVRIQTPYKVIVRIEKVNHTKRRPIKLVMNCEEKNPK